MYSKPSAPQSIGQVLDGSFRLFRASWGKVWFLGLLAVVFGSLGDGYEMLYADPADPRAHLGAKMALAFFGGLVGLVFYNMIYLKQWRVARAEGPDGEFGLALRRLPRLFLLYIAFVLIVGVTCIPLGIFAGYAGKDEPAMWIIITGVAVLAILPAIFVVYLMFGHLMALVEDLGAVKALSASRQLVRGNLWRTFVLLSIGGVIVFILYALVIAAIGAMAPLMSGGDDKVLELVAIVLMVILMGALMVPYFFSLIIAIYDDLKLRKEGGDLAARLDSIA